MGDYTPVFIAGEVITSTASAAVTGGDLLEVSGNGTVARTATLASQKIVGFASKDCAINERCTFYCRGPVHEALADGTVTAGDQVTSTSTASRGVKSLPASAGDLGAAFNQATDNAVLNLAVNNARAVIGVALTTASDNTKVRIMLYV
jgi:hypothetical protein